MIESPYLTPAEAARRMRCSIRHLQRHGPEPIPFGARKLLYHVADLDAAIDALRNGRREAASRTPNGRKVAKPTPKTADRPAADKRSIAQRFRDEHGN